MVNRSAILTALGDVMDPHMNISVVAMGMIREVEISDAGAVRIDVVFPCIGCPAWTMIQNDIREAVQALPDVSEVAVRVVWDQPWRKSDLPADARRKIRSFGYQILPME